MRMDEVRMEVCRVPHSHKYQFLVWENDLPFSNGEWYETPEEADEAGKVWMAARYIW